MAELHGATYKLFLSGSTNGRQIKVAATGTPGTVIHTTSTTKSHKDEVWLYAHNTNATAVTLTIEWGGVTSPDDLMITILPGSSGIVAVVPGLLLNSGLVIRAFASVANKVNIVGYVARGVRASTL